jgi:hypothetical protein
MLIQVPENADTRTIRSFAVLVEGEYTGIISFPESENSIMSRLIDGLSQNPNITPVNQEESSTPNLYNIYNVTVGEEYYGKIIWLNTEEHQAVIAGLESNPTIMPVELSQVQDVQIGWIWNGNSFNRL